MVTLDEQMATIMFAVGGFGSFLGPRVGFGLLAFYGVARFMGAALGLHPFH